MSYENVDLLDLDFHTDDPWEFYAWMQDDEPLFWDEINELWAVARYDDLVFVSRRTDIFCSGEGVIPKLGMDIWPDEAMINLDGKAHTCQRGLVSKGFSPRRIAEMEPRIREVCEQLIDRFEQKGHADLVKDFSRPMPFRIIADMLGYPEDKVDQVLDWTDTYVQGGSGPDAVTEEVVEAFADFTEFHEELLAEKKANPGEDLLSLWLKAELDGERLTEDKLVFEHSLLLVGGSETTRSAISMGMQALMEHPDQMAWLAERVDDEEAITAAIEEMIRYSCPFVRMRRTLTQDFEWHGKSLKKGDEILMLYPAANRDPRVFGEPHRFDVKRNPDRPSLSFGIGKHYCLGASLARLDTRLAVQALLRRLPDMKLADEPGVRARSSFVRSQTSLPVVFEPRVGRTPQPTTDEARCPMH
ncbi:MAG: cytochrome P450 [Proteobacteria bacterium]|nr:cytochrome P450 [Pseudomonadota bacterium]MCP4922062.1 cytochrome P450 [Pseudomonadota bacterium]